ncbi:chromosomal replication initiator protein DnaA, partial [Corallococcus llansteffanensis]
HYALTWLERMPPLEVRENALVLGVPDRFFREDPPRPPAQCDMAGSG